MSLSLEATLEKHPTELRSQNPENFFSPEAAPRFKLLEHGSFDYTLQFQLPKHNAQWVSSSSKELWQASCFEFFVKSGSFYWEWNWNFENKSSFYSLRCWRHYYWKQEANGFTGLSNFITENRTFIAHFSPTLVCPQWPWLMRNTSPLEWQACCILKDSFRSEYWSSRQSLKSSPDFHDPNSFLPLTK